ncbi:MAG: M43 family zinc metalloprotease [Ferruginibacter sp.]
MKSFLLGLFITLSVTYTAQSQRICGTTDYTNQLLQSDPSFNAASQQIQKQVDSIIKRNSNIARRDTGASEIIYIPVVIHLLYKTPYENISDAQIKSQLDVLNKDFRRLNDDRVNTPQAFKSAAGDARIQFCLAQVDPKGARTSGINRVYTNKDAFTTDDGMKSVASGGVAAWDTKHYLNIWVCKLIGRSLGYATPPGASADKDGVVMSFDVFGTIEKVRPVFNKGRTATHEIGHWLGLTHIWGDTNCGNDQVDDTPTQQSYNFGCPSFPKLSSCSPNGNGDMFMNFMDFSDDACMNLFTNGQVKRMRALFAQNNIRNGFLSSFACDSTLAQAAPLPLPLPLPTPTDTTPTVKPIVISLASTKVFPNPVQSMLIVNCKLATSNTIQTMQIYNSLGVNVFSAQLKQIITTHNVGNLKTGIYFIEIGNGKDKFITKVIKL